MILTLPSSFSGVTTREVPLVNLSQRPPPSVNPACAIFLPSREVVSRRRLTFISAPSRSGRVAVPGAVKAAVYVSEVPLRFRDCFPTGCVPTEIDPVCVLGQAAHIRGEIVDFVIAGSRLCVPVYTKARQLDLHVPNLR